MCVYYISLWDWALTAVLLFHVRFFKPDCGGPCESHSLEDRRWTVHLDRDLLHFLLSVYPHWFEVCNHSITQDSGFVTKTLMTKLVNPQRTGRRTTKCCLSMKEEAVTSRKTPPHPIPTRRRPRHRPEWTTLRYRNAWIATSNVREPNSFSHSFTSVDK